MWCLETIIALNNKAAEFALAGKPEIDAYAAVGITMPTPQGTLRRVEMESEKRNEERLRKAS